MVTCGVGPFTLAFPNVEEDRLRYMDYVMNGLFSLDIIINFISAYQTSDYSIVDSPKVSIHKFLNASLANCRQVP